MIYVHSVHLVHVPMHDHWDQPSMVVASFQNSGNVQFSTWPEWNLFGGMWLLWLLALSWIGHRLDWHGRWLPPGLRSSPSEVQRMRLDYLTFRFTYHLNKVKWAWDCQTLARTVEELHWKSTQALDKMSKLIFFSIPQTEAYCIHTGSVIFAQICSQALAPLWAYRQGLLRETQSQSCDASGLQVWRICCIQNRCLPSPQRHVLASKLNLSVTV